MAVVSAATLAVASSSMPALARWFRHIRKSNNTSTTTSCWLPPPSSSSVRLAAAVVLMLVIVSSTVDVAAATTWRVRVWTRFGRGIDLIGAKPQIKIHGASETTDWLSLGPSHPPGNVKEQKHTIEKELGAVKDVSIRLGGDHLYWRVRWGVDSVTLLKVTTEDTVQEAYTAYFNEDIYRGLSEDSENTGKKKAVVPGLLGCINNRDGLFNTDTTNLGDDNSPTSCKKHCKDKEQTYALVSSGQQCSCGNRNLKEILDKQIAFKYSCAFDCPKLSGVFCGRGHYGLVHFSNDQAVQPDPDPDDGGGGDDPDDGGDDLPDVAETSTEADNSTRLIAVGVGGFVLIALICTGGVCLVMKQKNDQKILNANRRAKKKAKKSKKSRRSSKSSKSSKKSKKSRKSAKSGKSGKSAKSRKGSDDS